MPGLMRPTASRDVIESMAESDRARSDRAREPAAGVCAGAAVRDRGALRPVEPDRRRAQHARAACPRTARTAMSCRSSIRPKRPSPFRPRRVHRSGGRPARSPSAAPRPGASDYAGAARAPPRRNPRRDRPARLELHHPPHRPPGERAAAGAACPHGRRRPRGTAQPSPRDWPREVRMIGGFPLGFAQPLVLLGLLSLPVLWWLLRLMPPRPRASNFPPTRLLFDILPKEETPARTPWWLTLLRLTLAALVILAAAGPLWNPPLATSQASDAARAADRRRLGRGRDLGRAPAHRRGHRSRAPRPTTAASRSSPLVGGRPRHLARNAGRRARAAAASSSRSRTPSSAPTRCPRSRASSTATPTIEVLWLSDGVDRRPRRRVRRRARQASLQGKPSPSSTAALPPAHALAAADNAAGALTVKVLRAKAARQRGRHRARARPQGPAARRGAASPSRATSARPKPTFDLPVEIRNDIARLEIAGERSAGAVQLLDKRWRRRTVGVDLRLDRRHRAAAARLDLLSLARAQSVRRRAARRTRLAGRGGAPLHRRRTCR